MNERAKKTQAQAQAELTKAALAIQESLIEQEIIDPETGAKAQIEVSVSPSITAVIPAKAEGNQSKAMAVPTGEAEADADADFLDAIMMKDGAGLSDIKREDITIPAFVILQDKNQRTEEGGAKYIPGAKPGMICNISDRIIYGGGAAEGIEVLVCKIELVYVERTKFGEGVGYVASYPFYRPDGITRDRASAKRWNESKEDPKKRIRITPEGNELFESYNFYCLRLDESLPEGYEPIFIPMSRGQIKAAKGWNGKANGTFTSVPKRGKVRTLWMPIWHLTVETATNQAGKKYFAWKIEQSPKVSIFHYGNAAANNLYRVAENFRNAIESGTSRAAAPEEEDFFDDGGFPEPGADMDEIASASPGNANFGAADAEVVSPF